MWVGMTFITGLLAVVRNFCFFAFPLFQCLLTIFGTFFILARFWAFIFDLKSCSSVPRPIKENMSILCNINGTYIKGFGVKVTYWEKNRSFIRRIYGDWKIFEVFGFQLELIFYCLEQSNSCQMQRLKLVLDQNNSSRLEQI